MRLIAPHLRRAVLIGRMFEFKAAEVATFADALDGLGTGMYLVDAGGRLIHANAAGNALLDAGDILSSAGGRLVARDAQVDRALSDVFAAAGQGDAALGIKGIAVPLTGKHGERYVAHALPLTSGARRRAGVVYTATMALFVRKAALSVASAPEAIGSAFRLSAAALSPFGEKAGVAAALFGFSQMAGAACGASLAAVLANDPAIGLGIVLTLTPLLALILHRRQRRTG